jgi:hypothetical protein
MAPTIKKSQKKLDIILSVLAMGKSATIACTFGVRKIPSSLPHGRARSKLAPTYLRMRLVGALPKEQPNRFSGRARL